MNRPLFENLDLLKNFCLQQQLYSTKKDELKQPLWYQQQQPLIGERTQLDILEKGDLYLRPDTFNHLSVKGAFYMLVTNEQLPYVRSSIRSIEERFNNVSYPWILLNYQPFRPEFKKYVSKAVNNPDQIYFGQIDREAWTYPSWIDSLKVESDTIHAAKSGNLNMYSLQEKKKMRYNAGFFFHHSLFKDIDYVWRVEPGSSFSCDMFQQDPFKEMKNKNKKLAFTVTAKETPGSMLSLWPASLQFMKDNTHFIKSLDSSIMPWVVTEDFKYNHCHFWTGFEILSLDFVRSEEYQLYFHYLDLVGGFFYERWTDGAVRTIAASMFLNKTDIHFMNHVGISQHNVHHCPLDANLLKSCSCDYKDNYKSLKQSCTFELLEQINPEAIENMLNFATFRHAKSLRALLQ